MVEEGHGSPAWLPVPAPGWGKPHPQVDTEPAYQRNAGRLRSREEVRDTLQYKFIFIKTVQTVRLLILKRTPFDSIYWDYALTVPLRQIVCIHCHQRRE